MPFGSLEGVRRGCPAMRARRGRRGDPARRRPGSAGRSMRSAGRSTGSGRSAARARTSIRSGPTRPRPMPARRVGRPLDLGIRCINTFLTMCAGQRMGIFAGSGVGKSVLLSMLARYTAADVAVIGLVGERGREVQEFLQDDLGAGRPRPLGRRGRDLRRAGPDAPQRGLRDPVGGRVFPRPGRPGPVHDRFDHALRHGPARHRPRGRRAAHRQGLHADRVQRAAAPARARRTRHRGRGRSRACSPCWSRATTTTSRWPTRCAASSTAIS